MIKERKSLMTLKCYLDGTDGSQLSPCPLYTGNHWWPLGRGSRQPGYSLSSSTTASISHTAQTCGYPAQGWMDGHQIPANIINMIDKVCLFDLVHKEDDLNISHCSDL